MLFVWALRIWSPSRWINLRLYHGGVALEVGHVKNPNKNPVAETCVVELGDELLCICPEAGRISPLSFLSRETVRLSWVCKLAKHWESTLLAAPSTLKPMEKLSELSKQQRTCFKRKMTANDLPAYQSTPLQGGKSPSELLFGAQIRCNLPCNTTFLQPSWPRIGYWKQEKSRRKMKQKLYYDTWQRVNELHPVQPCERVWVQKGNKPQSLQNSQISCNLTL